MFPDVSQNHSMTLTGLEPSQESSGKTAFPPSGNALSDALSTPSALQTALDALAKLTPEQRAALAGMLRESEGDGR